jgi:hypothetical protein
LFGLPTARSGWHAALKSSAADPRTIPTLVV